MEKTRSELNSVESELEQHRARALRTLQDRDKLIAELRNNSGAEMDDTSVLVELNQLRYLIFFVTKMTKLIQSLLTIIFQART